MFQSAAITKDLAITAWQVKIKMPLTKVEESQAILFRKRIWKRRPMPQRDIAAFMGLCKRHFCFGSSLQGRFEWTARFVALLLVFCC